MLKRWIGALTALMLGTASALAACEPGPVEGRWLFDGTFPFLDKDKNVIRVNIVCDIGDLREDNRYAYECEKSFGWKDGWEEIAVFLFLSVNKNCKATLSEAEVSIHLPDRKYLISQARVVKASYNPETHEVAFMLSNQDAGGRSVTTAVVGHPWKP